MLPKLRSSQVSRQGGYLRPKGHDIENASTFPVFVSTFSSMLLTHVVHFGLLGLANHGLCHTGEPAKEPLCKAVEGLVGRYPLDLASHHAGLEPEEVFHSGQIRRLDSFAQAVFPLLSFRRERLRLSV